MFDFAIFSILAVVGKFFTMFPVLFSAPVVVFFQIAVFLEMFVSAVISKFTVTASVVIADRGNSCSVFMDHRGLICVGTGGYGYQ